MFMPPAGTPRQPANDQFMRFLMELLARQGASRSTFGGLTVPPPQTNAPRPDWKMMATDQQPDAWGNLNQILAERRAYGGR